MARRYWETTYKFQAQTDVPFDYVCGNCGKAVSGKRPVALIHEYRKTAGKQGDLALNDAERRCGEGKAREVLKKELDLYQKQVRKGNYDFLGVYRACPHCHSKQKWAYSSKRGWRRATLGPVAAACGVYMLVLFGKGAFASGNEGAPYMIAGVICCMLGVGFACAGIDELFKSRSLKGRKDRLPRIHFPEQIKEEIR